MIHQYKNNGYNIVLDVCSGAVHVVDDLCYDVIAVLNENGRDYTVAELKEPSVYGLVEEKLGGVYPAEDLKDVLDGKYMDVLH